VSQLIELALDTPDWLLRLGDKELAEVMRRFADRFAHIGVLIRDQARIDPSLAGMGTTLTGAISLGTALVVVNVGDSRAYLCRDGELLQLTRDHTLAQKLADQGVIAQEETTTHRTRHVLTRALGGHDDQARAEAQRLALADGDQLLLCSDGLTEMVDDTTIHDVLRSTSSAREACQTLVDLALKNGGKDNVTVVVARYHCPPL
jgi:protein phosphatase